MYRFPDHGRLPSGRQRSNGFLRRRTLYLALALAAGLAGVSSAGASQDLGLGRVATPEEVAGWDIDVRPDGQGLPEGSGTAIEGEEVYLERCAACHGEFGEGAGRYPVLIGGEDSLATHDPVKTISSYWPYTSTLFDYIYRAMPFGEAQTLTPDEAYGITAFLLYANDLVEDDQELNQDNLADIRLPNEEGFIADNRPDTSQGEPCMTDCKEMVEVASRARVLDVTPDREPEAAEESASEEETAAVAAPEPEAATPDPTLVEQGQKVFRKCKACHQVGDGAKNRVGPHLNALFGRAAGSLEGFKYSKAMKTKGAEGLIWDADTLAAFLAAPKSYVPKTRMAFAGLKRQDDLDGIVAYLQSFGP